MSNERSQGPDRRAPPEALESDALEIGFDDFRASQDTGEGRLEVVDVRDDEAWGAGHIPGARHFDRGALERSVVETTIPDHQAVIIVYSKSGRRSVGAVRALRAMGYARAFSLSGGYTRWVSMGGDAEK